jgi:hypothetical protein
MLTTGGITIVKYNDRETFFDKYTTGFFYVRD